MNVVSAFEDLAANLSSLEINTIVKANMTGRKFPKISEALDDIASDYDAKLRSFESMLAGAPASGPSAESVSVAAPSSRSPGTSVEGRFNALGARADARLHGISKSAFAVPEIEAAFYMMCRIRTNALRLAELDQGAATRLNARDFAVVRKIWELGTEEIAFQTVIQLDGDVVTRLQSKYVGTSGRIVHQMHGESVGVSVGFWKTLVDLAEAALGVVLRSPSGK